MKTAKQAPFIFSSCTGKTQIQARDIDGKTVNLSGWFKSEDRAKAAFEKRGFHLPFIFTRCRVCWGKVSPAHEQHARRNIINAVCSVTCAQRERLRQYACCEKAVQVHCVCNFSTSCPDHGQRCNGSHE